MKELVGNYFYYMSFSTELMLASLFFALFFEKKKYWFLTMPLCYICMIVLSVSWELDFSSGLNFLFAIKYIMFYMITILMVFLSFNCGIWGAVFAATVGYCIQHISYNLWGFFSVVLGLGLPFRDFYTDLRHLVWFVVAYGLAIFLIRKKYLSSKNLIRRQFMNNWRILAFGLVFMSVATYYDNHAMSVLIHNNMSSLNYIVYLYESLIAGAILHILLLIVKDTKNEEELKNMKLLIHSQKKVYQNNKEMIDTVNLKAHDLKHQIHAMQGGISSKEVEEIDHLVNMYDTSLHTGNEALDIVLAEMGVKCANRDIKLTCLMDGRHIDMLSDTDIYSFFGNAIENAIEATSELPPEKRHISITENMQASLLNIRIENYCEPKNLKFEQGLPITGKDYRYHGFGTKSMKLIAEKYGGNIFFGNDEDKFVVNMILPMNSIY